MSRRTIQLTDALRDYLLGVLPPEPEVFRKLRAETSGLPEARMQISPEQGRLMTFLVELLECGRALEIGTFTGYSSLCIATALSPGGKLITCDVSERWTAIARQYWEQAGLADRIELRLGAALRTLDRLIAEGQAGTIDFLFVDADKENYDNYYERGLRLLRGGGLIAFDNALWSGRVADTENQEEPTRAIRALNAKVRDDPRVSTCLVPVGDGLLLARKR